MAKEPKLKVEVLGTVDVAEMKNRKLPNSDPAGDDNFSYQEQPWDLRTDTGKRK